MSGRILALPARIYTATQIGICHRTLQRMVSRGLPHNETQCQFGAGTKRLYDISEVRLFHRRPGCPTGRRKWMRNGVDKRPGIIYALRCPETRRVRYIGKTGVSAQRRLQQHLRDAEKGSPYPVYSWIRKLQRQGLEPTMEVLQECLPGTMNAVEQEWIARGKAKGWKLLNATDGGDGGEWSDEARKRQSERCAETNRRLASDPAWRLASDRRHAAKRGMTVEQYRKWRSDRDVRRGWNRLLKKYQVAVNRQRRSSPPRAGNTYTVEGGIATIHLRNGKSVVIDAIDLARVSKHTWSANSRSGRQVWRVKTNINKTTMLLARFIMQPHPGQSVIRVSGGQWDFRRRHFRITPAATPLRQKVGLGSVRV